TAPAGMDMPRVPSEAIPASVYLAVSGAVKFTDTTEPCDSTKSVLSSDANATGSLKVTYKLVSGSGTSEPGAGDVDKTCPATRSKRKFALNAAIGSLSLPRKIAPAAIAIVCWPCDITGVVLKWNKTVSEST